jgi:CSLREA domain-containing protein
MASQVGPAPRWFVWTARIGLAVAGALALSACHGEPHDLLLEVTTTVDGADHNPGDGVCEMSAGGGDCSLRAAVDEANAAPEQYIWIDLPAGTYALTLDGIDDDNAAGDLDLDPPSGRLVLQGDGAVIDAEGNDGALDVRSGSAVVSGIGARGGSEGGVTVRTGADLLVDRSAFYANAGPGVRAESGATGVVSSATISNNGAGGLVDDGALDLLYVTVTENGGGGVLGSGATSAVASVIAEQASGPDCAAPVVSGGHNLDSDNTCGLTQAGDVPSSPAGLGPLTSDLVPWHQPQPGSAAVEAMPIGVGLCGAPEQPAIDQRSNPRPVGPACDRGAVEVDGRFPVTVDTAADAGDLSVGDGVCDAGGGVCTLRAAIDETNASAHLDLILVAPGVDPTLTLPGAAEDANATGDLDVTDDLTIVGSGATVDAGGIDRVVDHHGGALVLEGLIIRGGRSPSTENGGGIRSEAPGVTDLVLRSVTVAGNETLFGEQLGGGGVYAVRATVDDSTFTANRAATGAGLTVDDLTMTDSLVTQNEAFGWCGPFIVCFGEGGGILVRDGTITNSTLSANRASLLGDAVFASGVVEIRGSTIVDSRGAIGWSGTAQLSIGGSVLVDLLHQGGSRTVCSPPAGVSPVVSLGYNVAGDDSCGLTGPGDIQDVDAILGPLGDNGGPTATHQAFPGSPALERIPAGTVGLCDSSTPTDQRGAPRPSGLACDAGAVEGSYPAPPTPLHPLVDTAIDARDADLADGVCDVGDGACSLRAAIEQTNGWPTVDEVSIAPGVNPTLSLTGPYAEDWSAWGDLDVFDGLTIHGNGAVVDGSQIDVVIDTPEFRRLAPGEPQVFEDLTITGGQGGMRLLGAPVLQSVTITGNTTLGFGGGISGGKPVLIDSVVSHNQASIGGGLFVGGGSITNSVIESNTATERGGGIYNQSSILTIDGSIVRNNSAALGGGGLYHYGGTVRIEDSTLSGNTVVNTSTAALGGGVYQRSGTLEVTRSTVSDNRVTSNPSVAHGAGLYQSGGTATVTSSTFTLNRATGTFATRGGAFYQQDGTLNVVLSTLKDNNAAFGAGVDRLWGTVTLIGSLLDNNNRSCATASIGSGGYNAAADATCELTSTGDVESVSLLLGLLGANGGPTATHLPGPGSPAIDAIPGGTAGLCDGTVPTDQRGVVRPTGAACDRGAVEQ